MKCLTLQTDEMEYIQENLIVWYCQSCITEVFPYNHIELDEVFVSEVNCIETSNMSIESLTELLFNPFELNSDDHYSPMFGIDPDMNY